MTAQLSMRLTEHQKGQRILDRLADDDGLKVLRRELAKLFRQRYATAAKGPDWTNAYVCADDARLLMSRLNIRFKSNNRLGALFRSPEWVYTGYRVKSTTEGSHGNELKAWKLR